MTGLVSRGRALKTARVRVVVTLKKALDEISTAKLQYLQLKRIVSTILATLK